MSSPECSPAGSSDTLGATRVSLSLSIPRLLDKCSGDHHTQGPGGGGPCHVTAMHLTHQCGRAHPQLFPSCPCHNAPSWSGRELGSAVLISAVLWMESLNVFPKALFKETAQPRAKAPLNYSPK